MTKYPSNVSDSQWAIVSKNFDLARSRKYELREIWNGIFYIVKTGCQWRMLPRDFPHWKIVYYYFSAWKRKWIIEEFHNCLVEKTRKQANKSEDPSVGIIDSQSVKNTLVSTEDKGFDAGKKIKGIKRHIIVDTLGLILAVVIQSASVQDRDGAPKAIEKMKDRWIRVIKIFADGGYRGQLIDKIKQAFCIDIEIIKRNEMSTFKRLPKRWIVERTFAWIDNNRRNSKNYERLNQTSVAIIHVSAI